MVNALDLNCQILALDTVFNREMLENKISVFLKKINKGKINEFEEKYIELVKKNSSYELPFKYDWDFIVKQYLKTFYGLTNYQNR